MKTLALALMLVVPVAANAGVLEELQMQCSMTFLKVVTPPQAIPAGTNDDKLYSLAQTIWDMATEYPQSAMSGLGIATFAEHVVTLTDGKVVVQPSFDAAKGIRSADMLSAIAQGRVQAGDAFAGSLEGEDAIFALPSLPFLVTSITDARRLADLARPTIAAALQ